MNIRNPAIAILLLLGIVGVAYTGYWFYAREAAAGIIADWAAQRRSEGYDVAFEAPAMSGYPLLIRAVLNEPRLRRGTFAWRGEQLGIEFQPWNFSRIRIDFEGRQQVRMAHDPRQLVLDPAEAALVARLSDTGRMVEATLLLRDLQLSDPDGTALLQIAEFWLEAAAPETPPETHTGKSLALSMSAADIVLRETAAGPLGRKVSKLRADAQVKGAIPVGAIDEALEAWRRGGGTVDIDWLHVVWGDLDLRAKGTVALDAEARPLGAFSTDIRGHAPALDALVAHMLLERKTATFAKVALALLAKTPPEGGAPVLTLPVTAQNGKLYAGPVKLLDLAPIRLPALPR